MGSVCDLWDQPAKAADFIYFNNYQQSDNMIRDDIIRYNNNNKQHPTWLTLFSQSPGFLVDNVCDHPRLQHWMFRQHDCPLLATERSLSLLHEHGTACQLK